MTIDPAVGSIKRLMCLISVDLPEPERPMITSIFLFAKSRLMLLNPKTCLCFFRRSSLDMPLSTCFSTELAFGPKILVRFEIFTLISFVIIRLLNGASEFEFQMLAKLYQK